MTMSNRNIFILNAPHQRRRHNICLTGNFVPVGLGVKIAERSDSNFHDKEIIRLKQLLCFLIEPEYTEPRNQDTKGGLN